MTAIQDGEAKHICHTCIGDQFMADEVRKQGVISLCSYCGETCEAITLEDLADRIHDVLQDHFEPTPNYPDEPYEYYLEHEGEWERRGDPVDHVIAEVARLDEKPTGDLTSLLSGWHSYRAVKGGGEDPYGPEVMYEEREAVDLGFRRTWTEFRNEIQSRSRFFSKGAEEMLADIFGDLTALRASDNRPVIREISPNDQDHCFWRGRTGQSSQELEAILKSPAQELGPPPSKSAKAGRMNAQGISVFYGAKEKPTCVSELRPPVGSTVVLGQFELMRPVTLLDLGALAEVYVNASYFDPEYSVRKSRAAFLRRFVRESSQPVMPDDEALEYLPTQVVAEYLSHLANPCLDGMMYPSSQTAGSGQNVVLFHHASGVEPYDLPAKSRVEVRIPSKDSLAQGDDTDEAIWVSETVPSNSTQGPPTTGNGPARASSVGWLFEHMNEEPEGDREPKLRLDMSSVVALDINAVAYSSNEVSVTRHRQTQEERDAFMKRIADVDLDTLLDTGVQEKSETAL